MLPDLLDTSVSCFVVRIWGGQEEQYQLLIEWKVNLDGLRYTGQQVSNHTMRMIIVNFIYMKYNFVIRRYTDG